MKSYEQKFVQTLSLLALFGKKHPITGPKLVIQRAKRIGIFKYYIFVTFRLPILSLCAGSKVNEFCQFCKKI